MRNIYWDKLMVVDDEFDNNLLEHLQKISKTKDYIKSGVTYSNKSYKDKSRFYEKYLDEKTTKLIQDEVERLNIFPIELNNKFINLYPTFHKLKKGDKLDRHDDGDSSFAISLYFNECGGGELKVENGDGQNLLIEPRKNRLVLLKGNNPHQVNTVTEGTRYSLQIFVRCTDENRSTT